MPLIDHFHILSPIYEKVIPLRNREEIIHHTALPVDGNLLDAGGGTGRVIKGLKGLATKIYLLDLSLSMLDQAADIPEITRINAHTEAFPFPTEFFDRIIMIDALHHVCDHQETIDEMWRVLKPGGRIVIQEPDYNRFAVKLVALAEKIALMRSHFLSPEQIKDLFSKFQAHQIEVIQKDFNAWVTVDKST